MTQDPKVIEAMACAISGAPFPSRASSRKANAALTALCAARPDVAAVLAGEAVAVPREATEAMETAGFTHVFQPGQSWRKCAIDTYAAMLAASPWAQEQKA